ncbi:MAG TPA: two-component regulator propeller domain-containing protein [Cytophagales bacterium]|nr:two-component regulator propeller domain-containing protein [Cytophagales bacterium]
MSPILNCFLVFVLNIGSPDTISSLPSQHVDKKEGLSNSAITSIYMDKYDYIWFGSWDGLNQYDGNSIKVFKPDSFKSTSISNNIIRNFLEDKKGNLWVVTHKGINKYNRDKETFKSYLTNTTDLPVMEYNLRASLGPDSVIITSFIGQGISRYDYEKDAFVPVSFVGIQADWLKNVIDIGHHTGLVYLLGEDGKMVCSVNNRLVFSKTLAPGNKIKFHKFFRMGDRYFLGISEVKGSLKIFDLSNVEKGPEILNFSDVSVSSLSESKDHNAVWIGTELGDIFKLTKEGDVFNSQKMSAFFPQLSSSQRKIFAITETKQDLLWVGTDGDGVYKFLNRPKSFYSIKSGPSKSGGISNSIVRSVLEDKDGTIFIGTRGGGLNIVNPGKKENTVYNTSNGLSNNAVLSLKKDKYNNLWIGVDGEGIDMMEASSGRFFHFPRDFEDKTSLNFNYVYSICIDAFGDIWLGTSGNGVIQMKVIKTKTGYRLENYHQVTHLSAGNGNEAIKSNVVYAIVEETPNILWFGTRGGGIYRYNTLTHKIEASFHTNSGRKYRLNNDDVLSLFISKKGELWIGTSGGLNRLSLNTRPYQITHFAQQGSLPNITIHGILEDFNGKIWVSTNNGLIMFHPEKKTFRGFDTNDGLLNSEYTDGAYYKSTISKKLYFGGINGLDIIHPDKLDTINHFPKLTILDFQVYNVSIKPSGADHILKENIDRTEVISLDYNQNFISFHFTTLDYWNKQRNEYAYFLENFDKDWNLIGQQSVLNLTNIPQGNYTLFINYKNENGTWNPSPKTLKIIVNPPIWRTNWAYFIYVLLLIGLQLGIVLFIRDRAKEKRAAAMNTFKLQHMKELNDYKLQFFTNVAHEFRTPLTLILGPITSLISKATDAWQRSQLKIVYNNSIRLEKLIEELIQFRKIESGKEQLQITHTNLVTLIQEVVESFQQHASEHEVSLEFKPEPETLPAWVDTRKFEKILINLISNAIKYNFKGGTVDVFLKEENNNVCLTVKDSGIGIAAEAKEKIFEIFYNDPSIGMYDFSVSTGIGLSLTKSLIQVHKGEIKVESEVDKGSTFTVLIPINKEAYPETDSQAGHSIPKTNLAEVVSKEFSNTNYMSGKVLTEGETASKGKIYTLLIVDDNEQILILLQNLLSENYNILTARNGNEGLKILEEEKIDLVISDILMPQMDGLSFCGQIKENIHSSHIPVILLTAKADIQDRIQGLQMGADSYIPKPFHPEHLFIRVEKLIQGREKIRRKFKDIIEEDAERISTGIGEKDDEFLIKITHCIQENLSDTEFTADIIAKEVGMSKASLYKKVKAISGLTPHGMIKLYRLRKAAELLKNSNLSVSEVIYETGFNSRSYFYKSFNDMFQCHPKDFGGTKVNS